MGSTWVQLGKGRERSVERFHPWIFSGAIQKVSGEIADGELVDVVDVNQQFIGRGLFANASLAVKVLTFEDEQVDADWFYNKLVQAASMRQQLGLPSSHTNAYRLMHGEGDGVPGLIIDVYNDVAVIQPHHIGIESRLDWVKEGLVKLGFTKIIHKPSGKERPEVLMGEVSERTEILENTMKFRVDIVAGQKTGFFLDQRDNRALVMAYAKGKSVLNVFSYTGGFSIAAAKGGAKEVLSIDASAGALNLAEENAQINECSHRHSILKVDAVPYLENMEATWDVIILDPPAFAKHKSARHNAIQAYRRINQAAIQKLNPGGLLFTFSCSQVVDRDMFDNMILSAAVNAGVRLQVLHKLRQPADHPVGIAHPEGEYLKGLVLRVE